MGPPRPGPSSARTHRLSPDGSDGDNPRPRKRRRRHVPAPRRDEPPAPDAAVRFEKELLSELTCEICFMLLYQPITTPCQHTFCSKCLRRSLDHNSHCPLCRQDLPGFAYFQDHPYNKTVLSIILQVFPDTYHERGRILEQEERDARLDTPIFVCQLCFPGLPTLLHFFEPRYRLMLRRCLESPTPCFGMIMPAVPTGGNDYGTMLEIRSVRMLPDGRSLVETWGTHRFRIVERGTLDGYMVGRIERIYDFPETLAHADAIAPPSSALSALLDSVSPAESPPLAPTPPPPPETAQVLMAVCLEFLDQIRRGGAPWVVQRLNHTYGPMPTDPANFSFWIAMVLPIEDIEKAKLLPIKTPLLRLRLVVYWIEMLNSTWWFTNGCIIS
ncbi:hypothetical protein BV25DRAFT_1792197 [Artomyces pyxidatus]|uniref:Uncharacterized protein n=1 Tax=Artomyces pyxidatus TaxID=48021 RepID=A0ACB8TK77_9AGAM|nr:hypothetical protein BV25DRAFT_1792197 [Artomyces pyxidatus]